MSSIALFLVPIATFFASETFTCYHHCSQHWSGYGQPDTYTGKVIYRYRKEIEECQANTTIVPITATLVLPLDTLLEAPLQSPSNIGKWFLFNIKLWIYSVSLSPSVFTPPVTNFMLLYSTLLCKKIARAPGGVQKYKPTKRWGGGAKQKRFKIGLSHYSPAPS